MAIIIQSNHPCKCNALLPSNPTTRKKPSRTVLVRASRLAATELLHSGAVRAISPSEAWAVVSSERFAILDVRPAWEREKARVAGSVHVPLFVRDEDNGLVTLLKKWVHFGYIGLWTGQHFTTMNPSFINEVEKAIPDKSTNLLVSCGEGLRSMMAISKLYEARYENMGWLAGGFNRSKYGDFPEVEGPERLEYSTIGGVSYIFLQLLILLRAVGNDENTRSS